LGSNSPSDLLLDIAFVFGLGLYQRAYMKTSYHDGTKEALQTSTFAPKIFPNWLFPKIVIRAVPFQVDALISSLYPKFFGAKLDYLE